MSVEDLSDDIEYIDLIEAEMAFRLEDHRTHVDAALLSLHDAHVHAFYRMYLG